MNVKGEKCMSRKGDNIRKRDDGRWEARYRKGRNAEGRIIYGSVYGKTYKETKEKLYKFIAQGETNGSPKVKEKTFNEILEMWMDNNRIRYKRATENKYQYLIETHILPELGSLKISELTATQINSYLQKKMECGRLDGKGGLSPSYIRTIMLIIKSAITFAANEQLCSPLKSPILKPAIPKNEISILNVEQQKKLESHIIQNIDCTKIGILISLHTGLRCGEVCALSWNDIDFVNNIIHVRHTVARVQNKGNKDASTILVLDNPKTEASMRDIPISSTLLPYLLQMKEKSNSNFVVSDTENFLSTRTYDYRYHRVLKQCHLEPVNYHALRHTFATRCIENGVDVKSLSEILGHSTVGITLNTYVHSSMELKRTQLEKLSLIS